MEVELKFFGAMTTSIFGKNLYSLCVYMKVALKPGD